MRACLAAAAISSVLGACASSQALAPADTQATPQPAVPTAWQSAVPWVQAEPAAHRGKGDWWQVFQDPQLNQLIATALRENPSLAVVAARVQQAQAGVQLAQAGASARLDTSLRTGRQRTSANRPAATADDQAISSVQNDTVAGLSVSYELDLFDRAGYEVRSASAGALQAQADLANARLVLAADLASTYFALRQTDAEIAVVEQSMALQSRAASLLRARRDGGAASGLDVAQQQAQLDSTATQLALLQRQRPLLEHSLATLSGQPVLGFQLPPQATWTPTPPGVPAGLPSEVLQRRPDVAAAQYAVAAANAQIGITRAAFYPSISLGAGLGFESRTVNTLLNGPNLLWSLGASLAQPLWDGGRNQARVAGAQAAHAAATASYRRTVLQAVQEVEDGLSSLQGLARAVHSAQAASDSAGKALSIAQARYTGGLSTYLDVVSAQQNLLSSQRLSAQLQGQQLLATAFLIKALGGGWQGA